MAAVPVASAEAAWAASAAVSKNKKSLANARLFLLLNYFQLAEQGFGFGIVAAEIAVELGGFYAASLLKQMAELACGLLVKDSLLLKEAVAVGGKYFGPFVAIISGCVTAAEYVAE